MGHVERGRGRVGSRSRPPRQVGLRSLGSGMGQIAAERRYQTLWSLALSLGPSHTAPKACSNRPPKKIHLGFVSTRGGSSIREPGGIPAPGCKPAPIQSRKIYRNNGRGRPGCVGPRAQSGQKKWRDGIVTFGCVGGADGPPYSPRHHRLRRRLCAALAEMGAQLGSSVVYLARAVGKRFRDAAQSAFMFKFHMAIGSSKLLLHDPTARFWRRKRGSAS